jgi:hypothetical protein
MLAGSEVLKLLEAQADCDLVGAPVFSLIAGMVRFLCDSSSRLVFLQRRLIATGPAVDDTAH